MKQFNLEEYLKNPSRKIITRDGRNVRIVCTNAKSFPIVALVEDFSGNEMNVFVEDEVLYAKDINIGDQVHFIGDEIYKD